MNTINLGDEHLVDLMFHLKWRSASAMHTDVYHASRVNVWRDYLPEKLLESIKGRQPGEMVDTGLHPGAVVPAADQGNIFDLKRSQFGNSFVRNPPQKPEVGRFYPRGLLKGVTNVFAANRQPFRCVQTNNGHMTVDFNHPLAGVDFSLSALVGKIAPKKGERGGTSVDWLALLTDGPGMQARWRDLPSRFFGGDALTRLDSGPDTLFYRDPRFVQHLDDTAIEVVKATYGRFLKDGMHVLDLMSSWQSHIPSELKLGRCAGLGLNEKELKRNPQLSEVRVQDLNRSGILPYETGSFDAVLNTVSIEYLVAPLEVFAEVARILKPGGYFLVAFSNRWFAPKAVKVWQEIHEFERMGMVLELFLRTEGFVNIQTYSMRGLPRPQNDKYFPDMLFSDPMYIVWGQRS